MELLKDSKFSVTLVNLGLVHTMLKLTSFYSLRFVNLNDVLI